MGLDSCVRNLARFYGFAAVLEEDTVLGSGGVVAAEEAAEGFDWAAALGREIDQNGVGRE